MAKVRDKWRDNFLILFFLFLSIIFFFLPRVYLRWNEIYFDYIYHLWNFSKLVIRYLSRHTFHFLLLKVYQGLQERERGRSQVPPLVTVLQGFRWRRVSRSPSETAFLHSLQFLNSGVPSSILTLSDFHETGRSFPEISFAPEDLR